MTWSPNCSTYFAKTPTGVVPKMVCAWGKKNSVLWWCSDWHYHKTIDINYSQKNSASS